MYSYFLQVVVNIIVSASSSYAKVSIAFQLYADKTSRDLALLMNGVFTQLGSLIGAVLFFSLVYFTSVFQH